MRYYGVVYSNELYHYGVLGMKWGVHRAKKYQSKSDKYHEKARAAEAAGDSKKAEKYGEKSYKYGRKSEYMYRSHSTKKYSKRSEKLVEQLNAKNKNGEYKVSNEKKRAKLSEKLAKSDYRANRSIKLDEREFAYAKRVKTGGNILSRLLTGGRLGNGIGSKPYQQYLAMQNTKGDVMADGKNVVKMGAALVASKLGGRLGSTAAKAIYLRSGEKEYLEELKNNGRLHG